MMSVFSLTNIILVLFFAYVLNSMYVIYVMFNPPTCRGNSRKCLQPRFKADEQNLQLSIYTSRNKDERSSRSLTLLWKSDNFTILEPFTKSMNVSLPIKTRNNGTLFAHVFLGPKGQNPFGNSLATHVIFPLTSYAIPQGEAFNLLGGSDKKVSNQNTTSDVPITHWRPRLIVHIMKDPIVFERFAIPAEIYNLINLSPDMRYLPMMYVDELSIMQRHLKPVNKSQHDMTLTVEYSPISLGKLRIWSSVFQSLSTMKNLGFNEKDLDEIKGIFTDTNLYFLAATFSISILHLLFDFLAFKNDINFWRGRKNMVGLSIRTVIWRCVSTSIIFLYLLDEETSLLVLVPAGIGVLIEIWKVGKAFKVKVAWSGWRPSIQLGEQNNQEKATEGYDSEAMKYLCYALYPLLLGGAVYSLIYYPHKSWYSWIVRSLVNGVYAFGFLFMLPQLFVNYKLKSVAHLPWRAFMYKAFNTFIDDVFAFIITMPTAHRLACFRDDLVFLVYLYQRWLYPVDMARVNEYGMSYEDDKNQEKPHKD